LFWGQGRKVRWSGHRDNRLPAALAGYLRRKGMDCEDILEAGLAEASDAELCRYRRSTSVGQDVVLGAGLLTDRWRRLAIGAQVSNLPHRIE
jgi:hypothetical protein